MEVASAASYPDKEPGALQRIHAQTLALADRELPTEDRRRGNAAVLEE